MTFIERLKEATQRQDSLLCVGLDPDRGRMPSALRSDPDALLRFCSEIVASTSGDVAAFKINFAFFEAEGAAGWRALERLVAEIPEGILKIADAKRADIGNTAQKYAEAILQRLDFDAVTVNPYLGGDAVSPFLQWPEKGAFVLAVTSNPGSRDFQHLTVGGKPLYTAVVEKVRSWNRHGNCGLVVGATHPAELQAVRKLAPELPFLVPGIGAQGGDLQQAVEHATDAAGGSALIAVSRSVLYNSTGSDFAEAAAREAARLRAEINRIRALKRERR